MAKAQVSLEFMLCTVFFILLLVIIINSGMKLSARLQEHNAKFAALAEAQRCALIADSLASNPEIKTLEKLECSIFTGKAASDFNSGFVYAKMFANVEIVGKQKGFEVTVHGSHYR
ncbi:MAG: hypothetical protein J7L44_02850 [Candidatus Diapherotrites archaeon]|nr:hypothetical protein [Candidatus Diapherotrites archaeon]